MRTRWFTADLHLFHESIALKRRFSGVEQMNELIIENWNSIVRPNDDVEVIGDFAFCKSVDRVDTILKRLTGNIHLVPGTHDYPDVIRARFRSVEVQKLVRYNGRTLILNHFPMCSWPYKGKGAWHLHGHCHGGMRNLEGVRRVDVGVDAWDFKPISLEDIISYWEIQRKQPQDAKPSNVVDVNVEADEPEPEQVNRAGG